MRSIDEIVAEVEGRLRRDLRGVEARRAKVKKLAAIRREWNPPSALLRSRKNAVFTVDQARMMEMDRNLRLKMLVLGHHVADVVLEASAGRMKLVPLPNVVNEFAISVPQTRALAWSHNRTDGAAIRRFISECVMKLSGRTPELQVQLQFVRMLNASTKKPRALMNLRPVMPFGFPTEIATVVDRKGNPATGNMDVLARTVQGARRAGAEFVVMELKKPDLASGDVVKSFEQAIGYATALRFEAADPQAAVSYRELYGPESSRARNYEGLPVSAHAVVVLPVERRAKATECLSALGGHATIRVGALLYRASREAKHWILDKGSFEWLGWQPTTKGGQGRDFNRSTASQPAAMSDSSTGSSNKGAPRNNSAPTFASRSCVLRRLMS
jgi:hypothetical protein